MRHPTVLVALAVVVALAVAALPDPFRWLAAGAGVLLAGWLGARPPEAARPARPEAPPVIDFVHELRGLLALLPEGILVIDAQEDVLVANPALARILRRPREEMEGVSLIRATRDAALAQVLREAAGEPRDVALGDDRIVRAAAARLEAAPVHAVLTVQDITALRNAERARSELVANVSHELRTPIAAARALAETLESGVDDAERRARFHASLTHELERLGDIVERLLTLSRLESRAEEFDIRPVEVAELARVAVARMLPVAERSGVALAVHVATPAGALVLADHERGLEVITNLLDNAIRYSPRGGTVTIRLEADGDMTRVCVRDEGPGILPADRQRVFERFYTADRARGSGTGLGLAIARHTVSRLGGEIWVAEGSPGATLCFTLPRADAPA